MRILYIDIDSLRADHLSCYGYDRDTMPRLGAWIDEVALFEQAYAPIPLTDPSLASLLTGMHPIRHGVRHVGVALPAELPTLTEVLAAKGFETAAFFSRSGLENPRNVARAFDIADFEGGRDDSLPHRRAGAERAQRRAAAVTDRALAWLDERGDGRFFLWLHYFDPHAFYDPPAAFRDAFAPDAPHLPVAELVAWWGRPDDLGRMRARYDEEILTVDHHLARVVDALRARGAWDSTLFVLHADHGESLGEHDMLDHGERLYQEQVHVPLLMRHPARIPAGLRVRELVRVVDLAPTIVELLDLRGPDVDAYLSGMDGRSFASVFRGGPLRARRAFIESEKCAADGEMGCYPRGIEGKLRAVHDGRWKLIVTPTEVGRVRELYDLESDPDERIDQSRARPAIARELESAIDEFWATDADRTPRSRRVDPFDSDLQQQLRALGYTE